MFLKVKSSELEPSLIHKVVDFLRTDQAVVIPTETVYGIACSINQTAFLNVYFAKQRALAKPLPVLISNIEQVKKLCSDIPSDFWVFAEHFWPGPVTVIMKKNPNLALPCLDEKTIALRFSNHKITQLISKAYGQPLFLTSANISGKIDATSISQIEQDLGHSVKAIIDAGDLSAAIPSTIINLATQRPKIVRTGTVNPTEIEKFMGWNFEYS